MKLFKCFLLTSVKYNICKTLRPLYLTAGGQSLLISNS
jgi:hypothetical protein